MCRGAYAGDASRRAGSADWICHCYSPLIYNLLFTGYAGERLYVGLDGRVRALRKRIVLPHEVLRVNHLRLDVRAEGFLMRLQGLDRNVQIILAGTGAVGKPVGIHIRGYLQRRLPIFKGVNRPLPLAAVLPGRDALSSYSISLSLKYCSMTSGIMVESYSSLAL
mgnify:CR=1 FL=1